MKCYLSLIKASIQFLHGYPHFPTPQSPTAKADKKRGDVLKAAGKCFRKTGFHQTSMRQICAETELDPGVVYRYFTGKKAIIDGDGGRLASAAARHAAADEGCGIDTGCAGDGHAHVRRAAGGDAGLMTKIYAEGMRSKAAGEQAADLLAVLEPAFMRPDTRQMSLI